MTRRIPYLRLLFGLKLRLTWRNFSRNTSAVIGAVLLVLMFLPMSIGLGIAAYFGFTELGTPFNDHLLRGVLLLVYFMWVVSPIFGYALTDEYDVSKLLVYPLSPRQLLAGATLGSVVDFGVMFLMPTMLAALLAFGNHPLAFPFVAFGLLAFLFHTLTLTQAIRLASAGVMRSRRARDLVLLLVPLISIAFYVGMQLLSRNMVRFDWRAAIHSRAWEIVTLLPPGLAARGIAAAGRGDYLLSLGFLLVVGLLAAGTLALSGRLMERIYTGEATGSAEQRRRREAATPVPQAAAPAALEAHLPPVVAAMIMKEFKHLRRDPYYKHAVLQSLYFLAVMVFAALNPTRGHPAAQGLAGGITLWIAMGMLLMVESQFAFNMFGMEGLAAATLLLFPSSRRQIIFGKNVSLFLTLSAVNGLIAVVGAALMRQLALLPQLFVWSELALVILIAGGNPSSVWFPMPIVIKRGVPRPRISMGVGQLFISAIVGIITTIVGLPLLAAAIVPTYWVSRFWLLLTLPLAAAYAAFAYLLSLHLTESLLLREEPNLIEKLKPPD